MNERVAAAVDVGQADHLVARPDDLLDRPPGRPSGRRRDRRRSARWCRGPAAPGAASGPSRWSCRRRSSVRWGCVVARCSRPVRSPQRLPPVLVAGRAAAVPSCAGSRRREGDDFAGRGLLVDRALVGDVRGLRGDRRAGAPAGSVRRRRSWSSRVSTATAPPVPPASASEAPTALRSRSRAADNRATGTHPHEATTSFVGLRG